jgi:predicted phosphodiesterase
LGSLEPDSLDDNLVLQEDGLTTIFAGDIHASDNKSGCIELLEYLQKQKNIHKIVLVGDILDNWVSNIDTTLFAAAPLLKFLFTEYQGRVHYLVGNHDSFLLPLKGIVPFIHTSLTFPVGNKKGICLHGHILDPDPYVRTKFSHYMAWFINKFDKWAHVDTRKSLVSLSERIKNDPYDKMLRNYEANIVKAFKGKFDFVIVGHSHLPSFKSLDGVVILNGGDSLQHRTLIKAHQNRFELIDYAKDIVLEECKIV